MELELKLSRQMLHLYTSRQNSIHPMWQAQNINFHIHNITIFEILRHKSSQVPQSENLSGLSYRESTSHPLQTSHILIGTQTNSRA